ncbi:MAG TPA: gliding motility lipoprotein GldH [Bacteroidales bacterium]|jgi:gliding motility-associated lipoprotein GldH|nr:gliding motility lipoprotein GldH [Bacteroidales bacterium]
MNVRLPILAPLCALLFFTTACVKNSRFNASSRIHASGWAINDTLHFEDSLGAETPSQLHATLSLRNNTTYPYQNLWLYIKKELPQSDQIQTDSIMCTLSDPLGNWTGKGWGSLFETSIQLPDIQWKPTDSVRFFRISIVHGMKDSILPGIEDIHLRLHTD